MKNNTLIDKDLKYINEDVFEKIKNYTIGKDDLYLTIAGTIGSVGVVPEKFDGMNLTENAVKLTNLMTNKMFLLYVISSTLVQSQFIDKTKQVAQPKLAIERIQTTLIPFPPLDEQEKIVTKIEELLRIIEHYNLAQTQLNTLNSEINNLLKKSILQEAIQGRLVPQIDSEESATVLLEKIKKEKSRLVKEGKLKKKDLTDSTIFKGDDNKYYEQIGGKCIDITEEIPFDIPNSWAWCRFGEYVKIKIGKTPARGETTFWNNGAYPWVSISDMTSYGIVTETKEKVSEEAAQTQFGEISPRGTLLMSFKLTVGRTSVLDIEAYHNEAIISIYPYIDKEYITRNYLFYVLPFISNLGDSKDAIKGKTLNSKSLYKMLLPVPPLNEQERIINQIKQLYNKL